MENLKVRKAKMTTTTVVEINSPKTCGSCESEKLKYMTEDYSGIRDTYWMCACGWEDFGATYIIKKDINIVEQVLTPSYEEFLDLETIMRKVGERGKDKSPRAGRTDKGKTRGPNNRTLANIASMKSKKGKSKGGK